MSLKLTDFSTQLPDIRSYGFIIFDPIWAIENHISGSNELYYVIEGNVKLQLNNRSYSAKKGEFLLVPESTSHRDEFEVDTTFKVFMIHFNWSFSKKFFSHFNNDLLKELTESETMTIGNMINEIQNDLIEDDSDINRMLANSRLYSILLLLLKKSIDLNQPKPDKIKLESKRNKRLELIKQARLFVESNFNEMITLDSLAQTLNVSPHHLSHVFSQETNFSLFSYITSVRMENAKKLLMKGDKFVLEVAEAVGYNSESYFNKVFKKYFNHTPSHYQGANLKKEKKV